MLIDYKAIGDTLTTAELNAYASLLANGKILTDEFKLKNGVVNGVYGNYEFDLSNASIVDNGILITDETLSNNITVKLTNPTQYATYTLHFTVLRYGDVNILDETTNNIETFDLTVDLITDTTVNIPLTDLQEYDVILFNSNITIKHDKPEIIGKYITALDITANKPIIQTSETSTIEITATDLDTLPMPNKSIQLLKNNTLLDTLTTDSQGKCSYSYTGVGAGLLNFIAKYRGLQSETYDVWDTLLFDNGNEENNKWTVGANITKTVNEYTTLSSTGSNSANGRTYSVASFDGDIEAIFEANITYSGAWGFYFGFRNGSNHSTTQLKVSGWNYFKIRRVDGTVTAYISADNENWQPMTMTDDNVGSNTVNFELYIYTGATEVPRTVNWKNLKIYKI